MLKPKIRFNDFTTEWQPQSLGEVTHFKRGYDLPSSQRIDGEFPIISSSGYSGHHSEYKVNGPGLVTGRYGSIGEIYLVKEPHWPLNTALYVDNLFNNNINYCYFLLQTIDFKKFSDKTGVPGVNRNDLHKIQTAIPSRQEQQKIADFLTSVDTKVNQLTEKHRLLKEYKKGVMQQIFSQQIRFKNEDGKTFSEWEYKKGNEVFDSISDKKHNSDLPILAITQEYGAIPRELINYDVQVTENSVSGYKVVQKGDFIISLRSFQGGIEYSQYHGICSPAYIILRPNIEVVDDFFKYYLKTHNFIQEMKKRLEGIRDGKILSYKYFSEINIPYPCVNEQQKIAQFLQSIDNKIDAVSEQIEKTTQFKKGLLQQMFV